MCIKFNSKSTEDEILVSICKLFVNPRFDEWNMKQINYMLLLALGYNGLDSRKLMINILGEFYRWYTSSKPDQYIPLNDSEQMCSKKNFLMIIEYVKNFDESQLTCKKEDNKRVAFIHLNKLWIMVDHVIYTDLITPPTNWRRISSFISDITRNIYS
jgi:hypothetical protein